MFTFWLTLRMLFLSRQKGFNSTVVMSMLGLSVGVATLTMVMGLWSGVGSLVRQAVIDTHGHIMVMKPGGQPDPHKFLKPRLDKAVPSLVAMTPFVHLEGLLAHNGKVNGIIMQGLDTSTVDSVLNIKERVVVGEYSLSEVEGIDAALVGKEVAKRFQLNIGDKIQVIVPRPSKQNETEFAPTSAELRVSGVLDFGKFEYNERLVLVTDLTAQTLAGIGNLYSGVRLKLNSDESITDAGYQIASELGSPYWSRDWYESNYNFFSAVELEKIVVFIVLLAMIVVASFNLSSTLFVSVMRRYTSISILKTIGANSAQIVKLFLVYGLIICTVGSVLGLLIGVAGGVFVSYYSPTVIPVEVYKFDRLPFELHFSDIALILISTFVIGFISTLLPAIKGSKLKPVEGLRYE